MLRSKSGRAASWLPWTPVLPLLLWALWCRPALAQEAQPCLNSDSAAKIQALLPGGKSEYDLAVTREEVLVFFKTDPALRIRLENPFAPSPKERFLGGPNFRIVLLSSGTPNVLARFAQVAGEILKRDQGQPIWSSCRRPQKEAPRDPKPDRLQAPPPSGPPASRPYDTHIRFFLWVMAACGGGLLLFCGVAFWQRKRLARLAERLDQRRRESEEAIRPLPARWRKCVWAPLLLLLAMGWMIANFGLNIEAISASPYLYPYSFLTPDTAVGAALPIPCENGFFRQMTRPMFGLCIGGQRLALLQSAYISALPYWPTTLLARAVPALAGGAMLWLSLIPAVLSLLIFNYLLSRRMAWTSAGAGLLILLAYPILICYIAVWFQDDAMAYKMLFLEWLFLDLWNQKGRPWLFVAAAFFLGMVGLSKLSVLPIGAGLFVAFAGVFGLRKASFGQWVRALLAGALPLLLLFGSNYLYDGFGRLSETIYELSQTSATQDGAKVLSIFEMMSHMGRFFFTIPAFEATSDADLFSGLLFCGLMLYCLFLALGKGREREGRSGFVFCAWVVLCGTATYFYLYRYRAESYPGPCLLPFAGLVFVAFIGDLLARLGRWSRRAGRIALVAVVLAYALLAADQWRDTIAWYDEYPLWFKRQDQEAAAAQLLEKGIRQPLIYNSNLIGLFEFLTYGELRPKYLPYSEGQEITLADWEAVLQKTRQASADFLFPARCEVHCASCRNNPRARELFLTALGKSGRRLRESVKIMDRQGQPMLWLERL